MIFRKASCRDIQEILKIIEEAKVSISELGIDQWQNGYPNRQILEDDISNGNSYVLLKDNIIIGTVAIIFGNENAYETIYDGQWLSNKDYATLHRIAIHSDHKGFGFASVVYNEAKRICLNSGIHGIRIDTHEGNIPMQRSLSKSGFEYCGIVFLEDGSKRLAYESLF